jgi:hypothetical protein
VQCALQGLGFSGGYFCSIPVSSFGSEAVGIRINPSRTRQFESHAPLSN